MQNRTHVQKDLYHLTEVPGVCFITDAYRKGNYRQLRFLNLAAKPQCYQTLFFVFHDPVAFKPFQRRHDIQHNNTQYNDTRRNVKEITVPSITTSRIMALDTECLYAECQLC
jgi:hypothetical protein